MPPRLLVRAQPVGRPWVPFGTDVRRGVYVEDFQCSSDQYGPADATFTLRRSPRVQWPDLGFWTPIEAEIENQLVWSGRVIATPGRDAGEDTITVQAQGWQYHLDDRPFTKLFAHTTLTDFIDVRSLASAQLGQGSGNHPAACQVSTDQTGITLMFPKDTAIGQYEGCSAQLDLGPLATASRIIFDISTSNNDSSSSLFCFVGNDDRPQQGTFTNPATQAISTAAVTYAVTPTPQRYISFRLQRQGVAFTPTADVWVRITRVFVFTSTAYESSGVSILKASDVVLDAFNRLSQVPDGNIGVPSFSIPAFSVEQQTPRDAILAANAFQDWQIRVTAERVLQYRARPQTAILSLSDETAFDDLSTGSGETIYNEVTYTGTDPAGAPVIVTRTSTLAGLPKTIPDRRGYTKGYTISSGSPLTSAAASQLCDVFLSQRNKTPFKGTIHATTRRSIALNPGGTNCPTYNLLRYPGDLCTFKHLQDPDTGGLGRDGRIARVTYTWSTDSAEVDIDSTAGSFEALVSRLAVATQR